MKFLSLVSQKGQVLSLLPVQSLSIDRSKPGKVAELSHMILVVDRSGSMYSDMEALRNTIKQVLALDDLKDAELLISLVSYSSQGDTTTHFSRVRVEEIMKTSSPQQSAIDKLRATMLTCISGGLLVAEKLVKDGETTCIVVHTDGFANHPSAYAEQRNIHEIVDRLSQKSNVVVNTIVYSWGDFVLLDGIASKCGGTCLQAKSAKDVYKAVHASVALMAGRQAPAVTLTGPGMLFAVSKSARKILVGEDGKLVLRGLSDTDDVAAYSVGDPITPRTLESGEMVDPEVTLAFARVELARAHLNVAKRLILASRDSDLYPHLRALTSQPIGDLATALETAIFDGRHSYVEKYGIASDRPTVVEIINLLNANTGGFQVHMPTLTNGYKRRGLKSIVGSRDKATNVVTPPRTKTAAVRSEWQAVSGFEMNRTSATINMRVMTGQTLHDFKTGAQITEVAGLPITLTDFKNYTVVGDGDVNVPMLKIRVSDKRLRGQLEKLGFTSSDNVIDLPLKELDVVPITDVGAELVADTAIVTKLAALRTISSMLGAAIKGKSTQYTDEQVAALKEVHVTAAMNASIPSTVPYDDKDEAISKGLIDSYTTFKIDIGTTKMPILSEALESANDGVKRYFEISDKDGKKIEKPTMLDVINPENTIKAKAIKTPTAADEVQKPFFDQFAGLSNKGPWNDFLASMGMEEDDIAEFLGWRKLSNDRRVEVIKAVVDKASEYSDLLFAQTFAPTVIFMGATGFLPDAIEAEMMDPEVFGKKYGVKIVAALKEATFFVLADGRVLSVRPQTAWFTTPAGAAQIKAGAEADAA